MTFHSPVILIAEHEDAEWAEISSIEVGLDDHRLPSSAALASLAGETKGHQAIP